MSIESGHILRRASALRASILALLLTGFMTLPAGPAFAQASYSLSFDRGWNMAGNSLTTPIDVAATFATPPGILSVWKWNATNARWAVYIPSLGSSALAAYASGKGYDVLTTIGQGEGYWVNATDTVSIGTQSGTAFSLGTVHISAGWNLAATGDPVTADALASGLGSILSLWSWDSLNGRWFFHAPALFANSTLVAHNLANGHSDFGTRPLNNGHGFWVYRTGALSATVTPGNGQVTVSWPAFSGAGSYTIQRSIGAGAYSTVATGVSSPYVDTTVTNGTSYNYIVVARDAGNTGDLAQSAAQTATPSTTAVFSALGGQNGLAFNLGGHPYRLGSASVYRFSPNGQREIDLYNYDHNGTGGQLTIAGLGDATQFQGQYLINGALTVAQSTGNQICGSAATNAIFSLTLSGTTNGWQGTYTASSCSIRVDYMSTFGGILGEIVSATLSNGTNTITINNAPFRVYQHNGTPGTPPALPASAYASLNVTTGTFELPAGRFFILPYDRGNAVGSSVSYSAPTNDGTETFTLNGVPTNLVWIVQNSFFTGTGNFNCGTASQLNMRVWLGTYLSEYEYKSTGGGSCVMTIDQIGGGLYKGHFTGTLLAVDTMLTTAADRTIAVSGDFRNFQATPYVAGNSGNEGSVPADGTTNALTLGISDGSTHWTTGEQFLFNYQSNGFLTATSFRMDFNHPANTSLRMRLFDFPRAVGTYSCGTLYGTDRPSITLNTTRGVIYSYIYNSGINNYGTGCTVNITRYDTRVEGTYTATLGIGNNAGLASALMPGNDATITVSGSFRGVPP